jgi:hypothetical protein
MLTRWGDLPETRVKDEELVEEGRSVHVMEQGEGGRGRGLRVGMLL